MKLKIHVFLSRLKRSAVHLNLIFITRMNGAFHIPWSSDCFVNLDERLKALGKTDRQNREEEGIETNRTAESGITEKWWFQLNAVTLFCTWARFPLIRISYSNVHGNNSEIVRNIIPGLGPLYLFFVLWCPYNFRIKYGYTYPIPVTVALGISCPCTQMPFSPVQQYGITMGFSMSKDKWCMYQTTPGPHNADQPRV